MSSTGLGQTQVSSGARQEMHPCRAVGVIKHGVRGTMTCPAHTSQGQHWLMKHQCVILYLQSGEEESGHTN